jgi:hypothetical protein
MLKPADTVLCVVAGLIAGAVGLFVSLTAGIGPALSAAVPVAVGVAAHQVVLGIMKRRAWQREHAERV